ncbi:ERF family protein (plasmid) [Spirosoma sp. KUDC1026]|nr:ERF family protein [Spirosoma sp. KUDC1026]
MSKDGISKGRKNQQQGYQFRGIDDVYNALSPILAKNKLCIIPRMIERDLVERTTQKGGALFYVTVKAEFDFVSAIDGSRHTVVTYGEAMDSADKATNKAMSAAYKYAAFQTFCIPTEGDNDADATTHEVAPKKGKSWSAKAAANARDEQKPANPMPDEEYEQHRVAIVEAGDLDSLKTAFSAALDKAREYGDNPAGSGFIKAKDTRKKELEAA